MFRKPVTSMESGASYVSNDAMAIYDLCDQLEEAIFRLDVPLFTQYLDQMCDYCDNDTQQLTNQLSRPLCKASQLTTLREQSKDLPALFVSAILARGVQAKEVKWCSNTPLILAAERGHAEVVKLLIEAECEIDKTDLETRTALHWASMNGHVEVVDILLSHGCAVDLQDHMYRFTPLMLAARQGHDKVVLALLESGKVDVNKEDRDGETALFDAVRNNQIKCVEVLLEHGADIDHQDSLGTTPIHVCVAYNRANPAFLLADANCNLDLPGITRLTGSWFKLESAHPLDMLREPLEVAIVENRWELAKLLVKFGANVHSKYKYWLHQRIVEQMHGPVQHNMALPQWLKDAIVTVQSLKCHCRKRIRKQLAGGRDVSQRVDTLPLPKSLKDFVLFKEREGCELPSCLGIKS